VRCHVGWCHVDGGGGSRHEGPVIHQETPP
jgi:hypothetical protein